METTKNDLAVTIQPRNVNTGPTESVLFQDSFALVTNLKCVFSNGARVYATSGITSVGMEATKQRIVGAAFLAAIGVGVPYYSGLTQETLATTAVCFVIAFAWYWIGRPWYTLSLHTAGGRYWPLKSRERAYVERVLMAINEAIMRRG